MAVAMVQNGQKFALFAKNTNPIKIFEPIKRWASGGGYYVYAVSNIALRPTLMIKPTPPKASSYPARPDNILL